MYPILFTVAGIPVETYYVFWLIALSLAMMWSVRRFPLYGVDDDEGRRIVGWAFLGMLVGARAFEYIWNFEIYYENPSLLLDLNRGGLSEVGAVVGAFVTALFFSWRNHRVSFVRLCDVVTPPSIFAIALGRWGCLSAGCCVGVPTSGPFGLHFPYDAADVARHPTQIYYSVFSLAILAILMLVERKTVKRGRIPEHSLVTPLGLILYSTMRLSVDILRAEAGTEGLTLSHGVLGVMLPVWCFWLLCSWKKWKSAESL